MQANKLNVYRNDSESWDFTNPNVGKFHRLVATVSIDLKLMFERLLLLIDAALLILRFITTTTFDSFSHNTLLHLPYDNRPNITFN